MKKGIFISLIILIMFGTAGYFLFDSSGNQPQTMDATQITELQKSDTVVGTGVEAVPGKTVAVNYTGYFFDGTKFDSNLDHGGQPFTFTLGAGQVIKGWDEGVAGMKVGGKRHLVIPPSLGYGSQIVGPIPANSVLYFDVELLDVK
jgi:FKBP-type peptidyl-prolyl cis-trans isomerase FkpA